RSAPLKERLAALVERFASDGFRPEPLAPTVTKDDARRRWSALQAFYNEHGHFLVTNGPYLLKSWDADGATLDVFRDLSYPLGVGSYDGYAVPRRGFVTKTERNAQGLRLSANIETVMKFMRDYQIERKPMTAVPAPM